MPLGTDARGKEYTWTLRRTGDAVSRPRNGAARDRPVKPPGTSSGVYLYTARRGARTATVPFAVDDRARHKVLVVLPVMTWQGRNPVDDDGDGRPNQLAAGLPVRLAARLRRRRPCPGFPERTQPLLAWLDRERHRYDITTDVALADGRGPQLRGHSGVLVAGDAVWLTPRLQRRLRAFVTAGGTLASVGVGSFQRQVRLTPRLRLTDPTPPATADIFGARVTPLRNGVLRPDGGHRRRSGSSAGTSGRFTGYSVGRGDRARRGAGGSCRRRSTRTAPRSSSRCASAAAPSSASACRTCRAASALDPDVQTLMGRTWDLLSR